MAGSHGRGGNTELKSWGPDSCRVPGAVVPPSGGLESFRTRPEVIIDSDVSSYQTSSSLDVSWGRYTPHTSAEHVSDPRPRAWSTRLQGPTLVPPGDTREVYEEKLWQRPSVGTKVGANLATTAKSKHGARI